MKKIIQFALIVIGLLLSYPAFSQTAALTDYCKQGAKQASTSGLPSTNFLQGIVPYCTITVYQTGTTTLATIYSDPSNTSLTNPFMAEENGQWLFYVAINQGYDVVMSGGFLPNVFSVPVTLTGLFPGTNITVNDLPASAPLIGTTSGGTGQPVYLGANCTITGTPLTLNCAGATPAGPAQAVQLANNTVNGLQADPLFLENPLTHALLLGTTSSTSCSGAGCIALSGGNGTFGGILSVANNGSIGPRFDVTNPTFGAVGDGTTDDTAAIQAAFDACVNFTRTPPFGGVVEFPGAKTYVISSTIYVYDGCSIEGVHNSYSGSVSLPEFNFKGGGTLTSNAGTVFTSSAITVNANTAGYLNAPYYTQASPNSAPKYPDVVTFTGANTAQVGQWVWISCPASSSTTGQSINNDLVQIAEASGTSFTAPIIENSPIVGSASDTCNATVQNVAFAYDSNARYESRMSNVALVNSGTGGNALGVDVMLGTRIDTGTGFDNTWLDNGTTACLYVPQGGINVDLMSHGARMDGCSGAGVWWKVTSVDSFSIRDSTIEMPPTGTSTLFAPGMIVLDDGDLQDETVHFTSSNLKFEIPNPMPTGAAGIEMIGNPNYNGLEFALTLDQLWAPSTGTEVVPQIQLINANDINLSMTCTGCALQTPSNRFSGNLSALNRYDLSGLNGQMPLFTSSFAAQSFRAAGYSSTNINNASALNQLFGDTNINQLWQYGVAASPILYSDTSFGTLPNATTLYKGQILAPPSYWYGVTGNRYAINSVYQAGTTGSPNGGATTCTVPGSVGYIVCSSATDLSAGQHITVGTDVNMVIVNVDSTNPSSVLVHTFNTPAAIGTPTALTFVTPVVGNEIQLPTKSSGPPSTLAYLGSITSISGGIFSGKGTLQLGAFNNCTSASATVYVNNGVFDRADVTNIGVGCTAAPTTATCTSGTATCAGSPVTINVTSTITGWVQGDFVENSGAAANGVAGYVYNGTAFDAIPLGNPSGQLSASQVTGIPIGASVYQAAGDIGCAVAADPTIGSTTVTAGSSTSSTMTYTMSAVPTFFQSVGQLVQGQGNTPTGYNGGSYAVVSWTATTLTVSSTNNPGAMTGFGNISLYCGNQTNDALVANPYASANTYTIPASYFATGASVPIMNVTEQFTTWSPSAPPNLTLALRKGTTNIYATGAFVLSASYNNRSAALVVQMNGYNSSGTQLNADLTTQVMSTASNNVSFVNNTVQPVTITSASQALNFSYYWAATGVASATYVSGGSPSGTGNVTLSSFNNSCTATATMAVPSEAITVTSRGGSCTAAPTTATCTSGTATCSGTVTLTSVLGGSPGNAIWNRSLTVRAF